MVEANHSVRQTQLRASMAKQRSAWLGSEQSQRSSSRYRAKVASPSTSQGGTSSSWRRSI